MFWSDLPLHPSRRLLRQFSAILLLVGAVVLWRTANWLGMLLGAGCAMAGIVGCVAPSLARPVYLGLAILTWPIGFLVRELMLVVLYFLVVTPLGVALRWFGRDRIRRRERAESYWHDITTTSRSNNPFRRY
jgi:hypothetical protein